MSLRKSRSYSQTLPSLWWKNAWQTWEIALTAPQVIAYRTARMMVAGSNPSARDSKEFTRMSQEKIEAFGESLIHMALPLFKMNQELAQVAMRQWWQLWASPALLSGTSPASVRKAHAVLISSLLAPARSKKIQHLYSTAIGNGLAPVHRRVTANAKRLKGLKRAR